MIQQQPWPCEAWPSDLIFFPDTYNDLVTFRVVVPVSSPFSRRVQYPRSVLIMIHDRWFVSTATLQLLIFGSEIMPFESSHFSNYAYLVHSHFDYLEYFYIFGTLPVDQRNIRNSSMQNSSNFGSQIFSSFCNVGRKRTKRTSRWSIYSYLENLFVRNFTRISFYNRKLWKSDDSVW